MLPAFPVVLLISALLGSNWLCILYGAAFLVIAWILRKFIEDTPLYFLVSHPSWLYVFTTFFYSAAHLRAIQVGLSDPALSFTITLAYQAAILVAWAVSLAPRMLFHARPHRLQSAPPNITWLLWGSAGVAVLPALLGRSSLVNSLAITGLTVFWVTSAFLVARSDFALRARVVIAVAALGTLMATAMNARMWILSSALFVATVVIFFAKRLVSPRSLLLVAVALSALSVFSNASLAVRAQAYGASPSETAALYGEELLSVDTLKSLVNPFRQNSNGLLLAPRVNDNAFRTDFYVGKSGLWERLTLLPQLDIIAPHLGWHPPTRHGGITNLVLSALPDIGQPKDLILSDEIVWDAGLRHASVIGRPMITAAAEFYALGGWGVEFALAGTIFFIIFLELAALRRICDTTVEYSLIMIFSVSQIIFTSTALSATTVALRGLPVAITLLLLLRWTGRTQRQPAPVRRNNVPVYTR